MQLCRHSTYIVYLIIEYLQKKKSRQRKIEKLELFLGLTIFRNDKSTARVLFCQ